MGDGASAYRTGAGDDGEVGRATRYLAEYLWDEVVKQQSAEVRAFLTQISILDELCAELCDAVTGKGNGRAMLDYLAHKNLFLIALDQEGKWFRFHHLFRRYLQGRADQKAADQLPALWQRAAHWYAAQGRFEAAIRSGLKGQDFDWVAEQIAAVGDQLWTHTEMHLLKRWTAALPPETLAKYPMVALLRGWASLILGDFELLAACVQQIEARLEQTDAIYPAEVAGILAILQGSLQQPQRPEAAILRYGVALEKLPASRASWRSAAQIGLAFSQQRLGELTEARRAFTAANQTCLTVGNHYGAVYTQFQRGRVCLEQGLLREATEAFELAHQQASPKDAPPPVVAWPHLGQGEVLYARNELSAASSQLLLAFQHAKRIDEREIIVRSQLLLGRVKLALGQLADANSLLRQARRVALETTGPKAAELVQQMRIEHVRLALAQEEYRSIVPWVDSVDRTAQSIHRLENRYKLIMLARVLWRRGELEEAAALLDDLLAATPESHCQVRLELGCLQAAVLYAVGEQAQALEALDFPLRFSQEVGQRRVFLDEGEMILPLLRLAAAKYAFHDSVRSLCDELTAALSSAQSDIPAVGQALIEPLSATELAILRLLALGLTNRQIADTRVISITTVKWHLKNIYGKLGVRNRTAAVARARALALLS